MNPSPEVRGLAARSRRPARRADLRQLRRRAFTLAQSAYAAHFASLLEVYEEHGLEAALCWVPSDDRA